MSACVIWRDLVAIGSSSVLYNHVLTGSQAWRVEVKRLRVACEGGVISLVFRVSRSSIPLSTL